MFLERAAAGVASATADASSQTQVARQLAALELHLDDLGFAPETEAPARTMHLRRCPYATLAHERTELMCEVHLDLARDVLAAEGGPVTAESLEPFVGPRHCLLHLDGF